MSVRLYKYVDAKNTQETLDSDEFPDNVFSAYKCKFNFPSSAESGMPYVTITNPVNGKTGTYFLPIEEISDNWINKGGYKIKYLYYQTQCTNNPSGNQSNIWFECYCRGENEIVMIMFTYDSEDNIQRRYRVNVTAAKKGYNAAIKKRSGVALTDDEKKFYKIFTKSDA